jgi:hypothetical protein
MVARPGTQWHRDVARLARRRPDRQLDDDSGTTTRRILHVRLAAMQSRQLANDGQSDSTSFMRDALLATESYIGTPDPAAIHHGDSGALVFDG